MKLLKVMKGLKFKNTVSVYAWGFIALPCVDVWLSGLWNRGSASSSESRVLMTKNWKKFTAEKKWIFFFFIAIYLYLGLHKGRTSYRRSLQPSEKNIQHFKTWKFFTFSIFVGHFCPPGSGSGNSNKCGSMRIRIQNPGDWPGEERFGKL